MDVTPSKWFPDLRALDSHADAARTVISARCATVRDQLGRLSGAEGDVVEAVHQTRVATRRLNAALSVFEIGLDANKARRLRKCSARIRRAAGAVRDMDVARELLDACVQGAAWLPPVLAGQMLECLESQRVKAFRRLQNQHDKLADRFERASHSVMDDLRDGRLNFSGQPAALGELSTHILEQKLSRLESAGAADLSNVDNVHQVRIAGKRLRYAMEIFAGCYADVFRDESYAQVEELQRDLGAINDLRHLYSWLADMRGTVLSHRGHDEREDVRFLFDRFVAQVGHDWVQKQDLFARQWTERGPEFIRRIRAQLESGRDRWTRIRREETGRDGETDCIELPSLEDRLVR